LTVETLRGTDLDGSILDNDIEGLQVMKSNIPEIIAELKKQGAQ